MKKEFFEYIGPADSLHTYVRSYKLVLFKCFFELMDANGCAFAYDVSKKFKDFYMKRVENGKIPDVHVEPRIENITQSSVQDVYNVILSNPFKYINEKGFLLKRITSDGKEQFYLPPQLMQELTSGDLQELRAIIEGKLKLYYSKIDNGGSMKSFVEKFMNGFLPAKQESFAGHPFENYVRKTVPSLIYDTGLVDEENYLITGSAGKGNWATVPWVCIFDRAITTSATKGVYIVYLLSKDSNTLYLTFNQGCTEISQQHGKRETIEIMKNKADEIATKIDSRGFLSDNNISLGEGLTTLAEFYEKGTIFYKAYNKDSVPSEEELLNDLKNMTEIYKEYVSLEHVKSNWWPAKEEFDPNLNKEDWKKYLLEIELTMGSSPMKMLKAMLELGGEASCKTLSDVYGGHPSVYAGCAMNLGRRVKKYFDLPACMDGKKERYFPFPFLGKYSGDDKNNYIYRIRDELIDALNEIDLSNTNPYYESNTKTDMYENIIEIIRAYKENFVTIDKEERYKWQAVGTYKKVWNIDAPNFAPMLKSAFRDTENLLKSGNYYPYKMLCIYAEKEPETVRSLFKMLYDDTAPFEERYLKFRESFKGYFDPQGLSHYQDLHAISVYLTFQYPEKYYIYKYTIVKEFINMIGYDCDNIDAMSESEKMELLLNLFDTVLDVVNQDDELQEMSKDRLDDTCYQDEAFHMLTHDIVYFASKNNETNIIGGEKEMTIKEQINAIESYIAAKGFNYDGNLVENFYLSLKSKPFVILAGTSGTGKTRLVRLFAEAIGAEYNLVSVRPDWSDSSDLFGHVDLNQKFIKGEIIDFVKSAEINSSKPHVLCLDEMNLARVEYYMSDILSTIETRRFEGGEIITDAVIPNSIYENDIKAADKYGKVMLPGNLYIVGTVNMDETTFPFSKKVLDRANTIEFSYVDLLAMPSFEKHKATAQNLTNDFLVSEYITLNDCDASDREYIESICTKLQTINTILEKANAHIGYRVRDEIVFYMLNNKKADLLDENVAFDNQIMQKILPRIQGSSESIKKMLDELVKLCESEKYDASTNKLNFMIKRYEEDGFTSYWL